MLISILLVLHVVVAIVIVVSVLLQQGQGANAGAAFGSGSSGTVFGARGAASFLSRMTAVLATVFMLNSAALAWIAARDVAEPGSLLERIEPVPALEEELAPPADEDEEEEDDDGLDLPPPDGR
ncbi:preprotein translocase subunit SecG [Natronospira proteinivora]|uniref:Protein-export membrane protein SecG n=1 Tax=Natronospira proteinivora TaxID=1807133 RepID=A0ABT1G7R1_9GAMM|nr:preprotein translocase subunit SecG [Natronospira proteinivora]MCP1726985.1 preprotein translocase subunit SecG [Natronospira proteinivora]